MSAAEIQLLLRDDFPKKPGGDLVLARQYESALQNAGHNASVRPLNRQALRESPRVAHLFNVDRYFEFSAAARALSAAGTPFVTSPVHHPRRFVEHFESNVRTGALKLISRLGRGPYGREAIKHALRGRTVSSALESVSKDARGSVATALEQSSLVILQAPAELAEVEKTFGVSISAKSVWVPNGVTVEDGPDLREHRDIDVLVAGRIEERKNQLNVASALAGTGWNVVFVGGDNTKNPAYTKRFHQVVREHENLHHIPHVSLEELRRIYTRSKVFLSASYFEVVSLTELEAVAYGCQLVTATSGYLKDYLGEHATYIEPWADSDVIHSQVESAVNSGINDHAMDLVRKDFSWDNSHRRLVEAYDRAGLLS